MKIISKKIKLIDEEHLEFLEPKVYECEYEKIIRGDYFFLIFRLYLPHRLILLKK